MLDFVEQERQQREALEEERRKREEDDRRSKEIAKRVQTATSSGDDAKSRIEEMKRKRDAMKAAASAQIHKPKPESARSVEKKEEKTKKVLTEDVRKKCFMWYARLGQPTKDEFIRKVKKMSTSCDITPEDVEALPWICRGAMLPVKELNELIING